MRKALSSAIALVALLSFPALAQKPAIEVSRIATLVDRDGRGFTRAPASIAPIANGRFALSEVNAVPLVVDSTGRLVKRFVRGQGPGEFQVPLTRFRVGNGDTLYATNMPSINVYDRTGKFVRAVPLIGLYPMEILPLGRGFLVSAQKFESRTKTVSLHIVDAAGKLVRSFLADTNVDQRGWPPPPTYRLSASRGDGVWAAEIYRHRLERWSLEGERKLVIDRRPAWFTIAQTFGNTSTIRSIREVDGLLWVMSSVPVPNSKEIERRAIAEATKGAPNSEVDARVIPYEKLETSWLEVYDASTGALLAELSLGKYGVAILDDRRFIVHTYGADDTSQLEIWGMRLRR